MTGNIIEFHMAIILNIVGLIKMQLLQSILCV